MKTIFITSFNPFISRNILNSDVLKVLREEKNLRIVIITPENKKEFILRNYGGDNISVEGIDLDEVVRDPKSKFWYRLAFLLENSRYVKDQRGEQLYKNKTVGGYINYVLVSTTAFILSKLPLARKIYRKLDFSHAPKKIVHEFFDEYRPIALFATDIFGEYDIHFMREAQRRSITVIGMVRSWDNTTTKGVLRLIPNVTIVNSPILKLELVQYHDVPKKSIFVTGIPQFDRWREGPTLSREQFFKRMGIDPAKRLILYAPAGNVFTDTDWQICQILKDAMDSGTLPSNLQFLVRNHPHHPADFSKFGSDPRFIFEIPGQQVGIMNDKTVDLGPEDNSHLLNSIFYSDIIMFAVTTLGLDAAVFNKPQIMISFDGWEERPYVRSLKRYNREDCLANLTKLGGTAVVSNKNELIESLNHYLENPQLDNEGRKRIVSEHMYSLDGKAGERIAKFIIHQLQ